MPAESLTTLAEASARLDIPESDIRLWAKKGLAHSSRNGDGERVFNLDELRRLGSPNRATKNARSRYRFLNSKPSKFTSIELFSGCGGMALGLANAGLRNELLVEFDKNAAATLRLNWPEKNIIEDDIANITFDDYAEDEIDVVAGGFPCQAFSYAGNGRGFKDTRGTLFFQFARCIDQVRPKIAIGENVRGLLQHENGQTLLTMLGALDELGYRVAYKLHRAQFHDVPQKRERLIILAVRKDLDLPFLFPKEKDYTVSVREALAGCPESDGSTYPEKKRAVMEMVPTGGNWRSLPDQVQRDYMAGSYHLGGGKTGIARRLAWDEPSLTLTCSPCQKQTERCHPEETRPLTCREYARLQTFPDSWQFHGSVSSQYKQIGNAVPVNLAYHIGRCVIAMLDGNPDDKTMELAEPVDLHYEQMALDI